MSLNEIEQVEPVRPHRTRKAEHRNVMAARLARGQLQIAGALYIAQRARCFHCAGALPLFAKRVQPSSCTKEHALPSAAREGNQLTNGAHVLAHTFCNSQRADRPFTTTEWQRAAELWTIADRLWIGRGSPFPAWIDLANRMQQETT